MSRVVAFLIVAAVLALGGGAVVLGSLDLPAPSATVEKPLPDQRFPR